MAARWEAADTLPVECGAHCEWFASWMRAHGKQAVLKDDEVERLERAAASTSVGVGRREMMEKMYGRIQPLPEAPTYSAEELAAMDAKKHFESRKARVVGDSDQVWASVLVVPPGMGLDCQQYKWSQNQSHVELYVRLPAGRASSQVKVMIQPRRLEVACGSTLLLVGQLYKEVKAEFSTWFVDDGVLHVTLLKRNRRGHYEGPRGNNADTFWRALLSSCPPVETLPGPYPPTQYYTTAYEEDDLPLPDRPRPPQQLELLPKAAHEMVLGKHGLLQAS